MMFETWTLAVLGLMNSSAAICGLDLPAATSSSTSRSRSVRRALSRASRKRLGVRVKRADPIGPWLIALGLDSQAKPDQRPLVALQQRLGAVAERPLDAFAGRAVLAPAEFRQRIYELGRQ